MKKLIFFTMACTLLCAHQLKSQHSGNINYFNNNYYNYGERLAKKSQNVIPQLSINSFESQEFTTTILANIKADTYVAIFGITQTGKTAQETEALMNYRLKSLKDALKKHDSVTSTTDLISFVQTYEYNEERKVFSHSTYNEIPSGFELRKNIHIKYHDPELINKLIMYCANSEVYDLVKVDYYSTELENHLDSLRTLANNKLKKKLSYYTDICKRDLNDFTYQFTDNFEIKYPLEMYESYQAYNSSKLKLFRKAKVNRANKSSSQYYAPIMNKNFEMEINPIVDEPHIQIIYAAKLAIKNKDKKEESKESKSYFIVTPDGNLKQLHF